MAVLLFLVFGLGGMLVFVAAISVSRVKRIEKWPATPIEILEAGVNEIEEANVYVKVRYYIPTLLYRYRVSGKLYENNSICIDKKGLKYTSRDEAERQVSLLKENCTARYDPEKPRVSVLMDIVPRKRISHYYALMTSGFLLIAVSVILFCAMTTGAYSGI